MMTTKRQFKTEPNSYEQVLHAWVALTWKACGSLIEPNRLGRHEKVGTLLEHHVASRAPAIRCKDGERVRIIRLQLHERLYGARH